MKFNAKKMRLPLLSVPLMLFGFGTGTARSGGEQYRKITPLQAREMMRMGNVTVLDVRTPEEYWHVRIPSSVNIPLQELTAALPQKLPDRVAPILVHCQSGARSRNAALQMARMGYTNVYDFGGILEWPFETERGNAF